MSNKNMVNDKSNSGVRSPKSNNQKKPVNVGSANPSKINRSYLKSGKPGSMPVNRLKGKNINFGNNILGKIPNVGSKNMGVGPNDGDNLKAQQLENNIKKATEIAKKIPVPHVKAAASAVDAANKSGITKKITEKLASGKPKGEESTSSLTAFARILQDPVTRTLIKMFLPGILGFVVLLFFLMFMVMSQEGADLTGVGSGSGEANLGAAYNEETEKMYQRILDIEKEYINSGKSVQADKVAAAYHILVRYDFSFSPDDLTDNMIREIFDGSLSGSIYSEDSFRNYLSKNFFPKYLDADSESAQDMTDEVFAYLEDYGSLINDGDGSSNCSPADSCTYDIKGFRINGRVYNFNQQISGLKVRLMQTGVLNGHDFGGTYGVPMENESLIDFEHYVLGVNYGEIGTSYSLEAQKAFQVVVRSWSLSRPMSMGNSLGKKLEKENGQWVLQLCNSVSDQVYCNPDTGCSHKSSGQWNQIYNDLQHGLIYKPILGAEGETMRQANNLTAGEVLVDKDGYIIHTGYLNTQQEYMRDKGASGYDYVQILLELYASHGAYDVVKNSCNGSGGSCFEGGISTGEFASWKQYGASWSPVQIGRSGKNIGDIGCLVTSIAIQIAKSGINTGMSDFNPGTFVQGLNDIGAFGAGGGLTSYASINQVVPGFNYVSIQNLAGLSKSNKLSIIKSLLSQGYYPICEVKGNTGQHWVAVDSVDGDNVIMMDPGSKAVNMWAQYDWNNTSKVIYYKAN